ncbi:nuclear transport factor 2 family protein [Massilia sp. DWR3-1-1]|uniref:nuclear transport factor 2 family protein n=1 Tax=Massilia sp. DWR3-1-1 TaxID=2804559 RepID=UPI003CEC3F3F
MTAATHLLLAQQFLAQLGGGASAEAMAALCVPDLDWNIPGDAAAQPWIGARRGSAALASFVRDTGAAISREGLEIKDILANDARAIILGHLQSRVNATGKLIDTPFAIAMTFDADKIASFLLFEDSYAVSIASR